ncbi:MAG: SIR2 family NAD-dependent protein deacylase [Candidatus Nanopelagicales bacterium]
MSPTRTGREFREAAALLGSSRQVVALTGAGISTDSGIPDFRGPDGVWTRNPGAEKMFTLSSYVADPAVRQRAWASRAQSFTVPPSPNPGHVALANLEDLGVLDTLVTQNIDGLHLDAGNSRERVVEIHGTAREVVCLDCGERGPMEATLARWRAGDMDPPCMECGGMLKSATISFGQALVAADLQRAMLAAANTDLLLVLGTTLSVYPVAEMVPIAAQGGTPVIIINSGPTELDDLASARITGSISETLPALLRAAGYAC